MIASTPGVATIGIVIAVTIVAMSCGNTGDQWSTATLLDNDLGATSCGGDVAMDADGNAVAV